MADIYLAADWSCQRRSRLSVTFIRRPQRCAFLHLDDCFLLKRWSSDTLVQSSVEPLWPREHKARRCIIPLVNFVLQIFNGCE